MNINLMRIALIGPPNSGKSTLYNQLTGAKQKIANYSGVTVERKVGSCSTSAGKSLQIFDLPGIYSFKPISPDEEIACRICLSEYPEEAPMDVLICVVDATHLRLHLRFALAAVRQLRQPIILALNRVDKAAKRGIQIDVQALQQQLGVPVIITDRMPSRAQKRLHCLDYALENITSSPIVIEGALSDALNTLMKTAICLPNDTHTLRPSAKPAWCSKEYPHRSLDEMRQKTLSRSRSLDDHIDRWVLHPIVGPIILIMLMFLMFQAVFSWAAPLKALIENSLTHFGTWLTHSLPRDSALYSFINDGIFLGVGSVLAFCPQIMCLFLFLLILESSGYLPRAAFLLDRILLKAGLTGRAFIPLLSSFACTIPSIMATRSIQNPRDRLITILVAPLITCSARLPVYTLLIAAFIPQRFFGIFNLQGIVLFSLYFVGLVSTLTVSFIMKQLRRNIEEPTLLMELPSYSLPHIRDILIGLWERIKLFLYRASGIILALTVLLWFLASFPRPPIGATQTAIHYSLAGWIGHRIATFFAPIGFNWQICIALIPGLAAREVAVSALGTVYAISGSEERISAQLGAIIADQWSLATALSLLAWYVFAPQCLATLTVIARETRSWQNAALTAGYLFGLAYLASFLTYQITLFLT